MGKLKRIKWEINDVYGSVLNWIYNKFARRCRRQAEAIYNEKFDTVMRYNIDGYGQRHLMWQESMDTVTNRPMNKIILKVFETLDK